MKKVVFLMDINSRNDSGYSASIIWWYGILEKFGYEVFYEDYAEYNAEEFYEKMKHYKPDFIFHPTYTKVHTEFIKLKEFTKVFIIQSDDMWRYDNFSKYWIPYIHGTVTFEGVKENYIRDGLDEKNFHKIKWCFNPNTQDLDKTYKKDIEISHIGNVHSHQYRVEQINKFRNLGIDVQIFHGVNYEEAKRAWAHSKYTLSFTMNSSNTVREPKGRVVEVPNFAVLFTEDFPGLKEYYNNDEMVVFSSVEDCIEKINYFDKNPKELEKIYLKGKKALWGRNTVYHEWNKILPQIDEDYKKINPNEIIKKYHNK